MDSDSIFTKIVKGELPSYKVDQNDKFLAILDIFPSHDVQILVISKEEVPSKVTDVDPELVAEGVKFAHQIAKKIESVFKDFVRCQIVIEGFDVDHFHIKIYPARSSGDAVTKNLETEKADEKFLTEILEKLTAGE